ncbi:MAG: hypothetical protein QM695_09790 [Micropruina sp.]
MIIVRPMQYTSRVAQYRELFGALGLAEMPADQGGDATPDWTVFQAGSGRVGLHAVPDGDPLDGQAALGFETDELDAVAVRLAASCRVRRFGRSGGRAIEAIAPDGLSLVFLAPTAGEASPAFSASSEVSVPFASSAVSALGLWMTADTGRATRVLQELGLDGRVRSDSGRWFQASADGGGLAAVHEGGDEPRAELSFEYDGEVDALAERLEAAGIGCNVVDESYGRTLLVDRPGGGEPIWVNERQTDLYGYVALSGRASGTS